MKLMLKIAFGMFFVFSSGLCFGLNEQDETGETLNLHGMQIPASPLYRFVTEDNEKAEAVYTDGLLGNIKSKDVSQEQSVFSELSQMSSKIAVLEARNKQLLDIVTRMDVQIRQYENNIIQKESSIADLQNTLSGLARSVEGNSREVALIRQENKKLKNTAEEGIQKLSTSVRDLNLSFNHEKNERVRADKSFEENLSDSRSALEMQHLSVMQMYDRLSLSIMIISACYVFVFLVFIIFFSGRFKRLGAVHDELRSEIKKSSSGCGGTDSDFAALNDRLLTLMEKGSSGAADKDETSTVLEVANEVARIQTNLFRMDKSVKGYKQLERAAERITEIFAARGYEIRSLIGSEYSENMKCSATFADDDTIEPGKQIITGIKKAMVVYNGKMIQTPEITVSSRAE